MIGFTYTDQDNDISMIIKRRKFKKKLSKLLKKHNAEILLKAYYGEILISVDGKTHEYDYDDCYEKLNPKTLS